MNFTDKTITLANETQMPIVIAYAKKSGIYDQLGTYRFWPDFSFDMERHLRRLLKLASNSFSPLRFLSS